MGVGCLGIKKGLRTGQKERPGVGLLRETGIGSSPHMTIRGSEGFWESQAQKTPLDGGVSGASCRRQNTQYGEIMPSAAREVKQPPSSDKLPLQPD